MTDALLRMENLKTNMKRETETQRKSTAHMAGGGRAVGR